MTFDLDLWSTDLNINRVHLLIQDYLHTKSEACWAKYSRVISCTRLRDTDIPIYRPAYRPTCAKHYAPSFSKGGIIIICYLKLVKYNKLIFNGLGSRKKIIRTLFISLDSNLLLSDRLNLISIYNCIMYKDSNRMKWYGLNISIVN